MAALKNTAPASDPVEAALAGDLPERARKLIRQESLVPAAVLIPLVGASDTEVILTRRPRHPVGHHRFEDFAVGKQVGIGPPPHRESHLVDENIQQRLAFGPQCGVFRVEPETWRAARIDILHQFAGIAGGEFRGLEHRDVSRAPANLEASTCSTGA